MKNDVIAAMKEFENNRKYFVESVSRNPEYFGNFVLVDNKEVKYACKNQKEFSGMLKKLGESGNKTAYWSYVYNENEGEALNA